LLQSTKSTADMPSIVACPHEMTALSAAHVHAMRSRRPQMVLVHVDVGTQNLGCSIHNAARGRVPAVIVAGLSPVSVSGERTGARTEFIHYTQDSTRQHEIGGQYMKWSYELRAPEMVDQVLMRSMQIASTEPAGPVYLTGAREVWDEPAAAIQQPLAHWAPAVAAGLPEGDAGQLSAALWNARKPLVITSYLGRQPDAAQKLAELSERIGIAVCEVNPQYVNCPGDHPNHVGYRRNALVDEADLILMPSVSGVVRIGSPDGFGSVFLAPRLVRLQQQHPDLTIELIAVSRQLNLAKRESDIAIAVDRPSKGHQVIRKLADCYSVVYASAEYLETHPPIQSIRDLKDHSFVGYVEDFPFVSDFFPDIPDYQKNSHARLTSTNMIAQLRATVAGAGLCLMPRYMVEGEPNLRPVLPSETQVCRELWLTVHPEIKDFARIRVVWQFIREEVAAHRELFL